MTEGPLVSVGIPCYNRPEGLRRTLECITGQTYLNLEIIVSDNCSPDPEVERVGREFANKDIRVQYFRQNLNIGPMPNFQFVLEKATGEYFMWAADDDEWDLDSINLFVGEFERDTEISVVMSACKRVDENGQLYDIIQNFKSKLNINYTSPFKLVLDASTNYYWTYLICGLFQTDYLKKTFKFVPDVFGFDVLFICHVLMSTKISYIDNILYIRGVHIEGTAIRYENEKIGTQYSDPLKFHKMIYSFGSYLMGSDVIPMKNKVWIPFIIFHMTLLQIISNIKMSIFYLISKLKQKFLAV